jgi:hypothetical protein
MILFAGRDAMIYAISHRYYWKGMSRDISDYVKSCFECQQMARKSTKSPLQPIKINGNFEQWQLDLFRTKSSFHSHSSNTFHSISFFPA